MVWSPCVNSKVTNGNGEGSNSLGQGSSSKKGDQPIGKGDEDLVKRANPCLYSSCSGYSKANCDTTCCIWSRQHKECESA
ncbi:unnamed protein product [Allacma fusca]|uniref:Uncharacterized protein n=1 Tax=Allacma fusca TaxID=39272 RepID=A0A8J2Q0J8_9HEXA|nr:unnamed protein product [Allacma fusca]